MKLANPLNYPIAVFAGGVVLFVGVRPIGLPSTVVIPAAVGVAVAGASYLKSRQGESPDLNNPELAVQLQSIRAMAATLAAKSNDLRAEATKLLTSSAQIELLAAVQLSCDRVLELPSKIDNLAKRFKGDDSILSVSELQLQLAEVRQKLRSSSGIASQHLDRLADSLQRNIDLAQEGRDTRLAQILNLSTIVQNSAGVLQRLQNQFRKASLTDSEQIEELRLLNDELNSLQENFDLLVRQTNS
jgi:hypothetical protein